MAMNAGCFVHVFGEYVAELTLLIGPSMLPTLNKDSNGDIVITEHLSTRFNGLKRGDVVIARSPEEPTCFVCKRIAAVNGEIVKTGPQDKDYIKIPKGHVWLLGDNLEDSNDSREYGPVPYGLIQGRVCYRVWPLSSIGSIPDHPNRYRTS